MQEHNYEVGEKVQINTFRDLPDEGEIMGIECKAINRMIKRYTGDEAEIVNCLWMDSEDLWLYQLKSRGTTLPYLLTEDYFYSDAEPVSDYYITTDGSEGDRVYVELHQQTEQEDRVIAKGFGWWDGTAAGFAKAVQFGTKHISMNLEGKK